MKRVLNFSVVALLAIVVLASCTKSRDYFDDRNYTEDATVEYDENSPFSILSFSSGEYAVFKTLSSNPDIWPYRYEIIRGNFQSTGSRSFKNVTGNYTFNANVVEFFSNYLDARDALDEYAIRDGYAITNKTKISASARLRPVIK